ncbi:MAG: lactate utilization protein B [Thermocladium sp.]|jgi:L-lactate dehydrogenase complex protein LldG|nr:MAG: (Fe-S)-binding protein [Thermocladium sp. ECH_B]
MSWDAAISRAVEHNVPRTMNILEKYPYIKDLAEELRRAKEAVIRDMDKYVDETMAAVRALGGKAYLAGNAEEARRIVGNIVGSGKIVVMGKSMVAAEAGIREHLAGMGNEVWETDLGEFLIQLAGEAPSHIIAPALHMTRERAAQVLRERLGIDVKPDPVDIARVAREFLREKFVKAGVGITGANAVAADTGAVLLVENEGNIRFTTVAPPIHVSVTGIDKIVPTLHHAMMEVLVQAAYAGLYPPTYVNLVAGPSSTGDVEQVRVSPAEGPREFHLVLLDNGRRRAASHPVLWETLLCIRCGRCHFHCPVYRAMDGAWGDKPYSGPMGVMWSAVINGVEKAGRHAVLCTHAGTCREVCPMKINIPDVIHWIRTEYMRSIKK